MAWPMSHLFWGTCVVCTVCDMIIIFATKQRIFICCNFLEKWLCREEFQEQFLGLIHLIEQFIKYWTNSKLRHQYWTRNKIEDVTQQRTRKEITNILKAELQCVNQTLQCLPCSKWTLSTSSLHFLQFQIAKSCLFSSLSHSQLTTLWVACGELHCSMPHILSLLQAGPSKINALCLYELCLRICKVNTWFTML